MAVHVKREDTVKPWNGGLYYQTGARCYHMGRTWRATLDICNPAFEPGGYAPYGWTEEPRGLTPETTRREYHTQLAESYARSAPHGGNRAVLNHMVKVAGMSDDDWPAHRAELLDNEPARRAAAKEMVDELLGREAGE